MCGNNVKTVTTLVDLVTTACAVDQVCVHRYAAIKKSHQAEVYILLNMTARVATLRLASLRYTTNASTPLCNDITSEGIHVY